MERFLGELHHFMALSPRVDARVDEEWRNDVRYRRHGSCHLVNGRVTEEHTHATAHLLLLSVSRSEAIQFLAPLVNLVTQVYLHRAHRLTTQAERAS